MRAAVDVPILANMTEFGKSDLYSVQQLQDVGVNLVIFPVSLLRIAMGAIERGLDALAAEGSLRLAGAADADPRSALRTGRLRGVLRVRRGRLLVRPQHQPQLTHRTVEGAP